MLRNSHLLIVPALAACLAGCAEPGALTPRGAARQSLQRMGMWREVNRGTYMKVALNLVDETIDYEIANQPGDLTAVFGRITSPQVREVIAIYDDLHKERNRKKGMDSLSLLKMAHIRLHSKWLARMVRYWRR